jgi:squalene-hopene/tetraprenyl-beta-curcumene cyclase
VHPYTGADPGGWAWTDLPGGVPDADDTPGALLALHHLGFDDAETRAAAAAGAKWLLDLQNSDGGMPTFCRGWGSLPFDRSGSDLTAHALAAWAAWRDRLPGDLAAAVDSAASAAGRYLRSRQAADGSWTPLWFGNQSLPGEENPVYGTARVVPSLYSPATRAARLGGAEWLLSRQDPDGGWGGATVCGRPGLVGSIEETALAVHALACVERDEPSLAVRTAEALRRGTAWLIDRTDRGRSFEPSPIGFYFAKLWYFEKLYPLVYAVGALERVAARPTRPA